jgi:hypothetical protein
MIIMDNLVNSREEQTRGFCSNTQKPYVKIELDLHSIFDRKQLSMEARYVYLTLAQKINIDGDKVSITTKQIEVLFGISRRKREIIFKELFEKGFLQILTQINAANVYRLTIGVFKGIKKQPYSKKRSFSFNGQQLSYPPNTENKEKCYVHARHDNVHGVMYKPGTKMYTPHVRAKKLLYKNYLIQDKQQHVPDDAFSEIIKSLKSNSPFRDLTTNTLRSFANTFGLDLLKKRINGLDDYGYTREKIKETAAGLLYSALKYGDQWELANKKTQEARKREEKLATSKDMARRVFEEEAQDNRRKQLEYGEDEQIYCEAKNDMSIIENAKAILETTAPGLERNNPALFEGRLKYKIIELYKKQRQYG